jgi:ABC-type phosphate/phosphonate transport system permease subunit
VAWRFTAAERAARTVFAAVALAALVWSPRIEVIPEFLYDAPQQTADLFTRMWPFDWKYYPAAVHAGAHRDLPHRHAGHAVAPAHRIPLALPAARNFNAVAR